MKNENSTRFYSDKHEKSICRALGAQQQANSGATKFSKGDVIKRSASLLVEAKCSMTKKYSFSIKEDWLIKNKQEAFQMGLSNNVLCFNFEPDGNNYYVIDEKTMKFLVESLCKVESEDSNEK